MKDINFEPIRVDEHHGVPVLPAFESGANFWVFCYPCRKFHFHGRVEGMLSSHCLDRHYSYSLKYAGLCTKKVKQAAAKLARRLKKGLEEIPQAVLKELERN